MAVTKGVDIVIMVDTGSGTPTWSIVGGQQNATLSETADTMETTNKQSSNYREFDYSLNSWTISADGVLILDDVAYAALVDAMRGQEKVKVRVKESATKALEGFAIVTSRDLDAPYDDVATYSVELQGTGALSEVTLP